MIGTCPGVAYDSPQCSPGNLQRVRFTIQAYHPNAVIPCIIDFLFAEIDADLPIKTANIATMQDGWRFLVSEQANCAKDFFLLRGLVVNAQQNGNPPYATYDVRNAGDPYTSALGVTGVTPVTSRFSPITIQCGTQQWTMGSYQATTLRVAYKDLDDGRYPCSTPPDIVRNHPCPGTELKARIIDRFKQLRKVTPEPYDVRKVNNEMINPKGTGYIDIMWQPRCEDPSQVNDIRRQLADSDSIAKLGLQMLCFTAGDNSSVYTANFQYLYSMPSPLLSGDSTSFAPSCIFVNSLPSSSLNPPKFVLPAGVDSCTENCCTCCALEVCDCKGQSKCCEVIYATAGEKFRYSLQAQDSNPLRNVTMLCSWCVHDGDDQVTINVSFDKSYEVDACTGG
eukprot:556556-Hanusia_phi.AAC.2